MKKSYSSGSLRKSGSGASLPPINRGNGNGDRGGPREFVDFNAHSTAGIGGVSHSGLVTVRVCCFNV